MRPVALLGVGAGTPSRRLAASEVAAAWGSGGGRGAVAVCDSDEDTLTLAWQAAVGALEAAGVSPADVSGLWWGTSRPPMAEGPSHVFLATALGLDPGAGGALCAGSPHAGMDALTAAWDALGAGHATVAVVVASDALVPGPGTAAEATTGAGAAAFVLGALDGERPSGPSSNGSSPPARLVARVTRALPVLDRYRPDAASSTEDVYDGRLFREEVFVPLVSDAGRALASETSTPSTWSLADPDGKLGSAVAKRLGGPLASAAPARALGDTAAAAPFLGVVQACAEIPDGPGPVTVGMIGYGGGRATAVAVEVHRAVPGAHDIGARPQGRAASYVEVLRSRNLLEPAGEPIQMGVPPGSAAFVRGNTEMLGLRGARCRTCGAISTPPSIHPTCVGCGGGQLDEVGLARRGTVQTFVVNQTMPPPFQAPLPIVVVDLDDGARIMVQGSPADAALLAVDDTVNLELRRYALERGVPVYGYKAMREHGGGGGADGAPAGALRQEGRT
jgi:hydroxymethylglutaryl-CoA synthase